MSGHQLYQQIERQADQIAQQSVDEHGGDERFRYPVKCGALQAKLSTVCHDLLCAQLENNQLRRRIAELEEEETA